MKVILITCLVVLLLIVAVSCNHQAYHQTNKSYKKQAKTFAKTLQKTPDVFSVNESTPSYWIGTTNFNMRKPNYVIIHHTAQNTCEETFRTFTLPRTQVSAHYVICKDGKVQHMLNDYLRAWHAGVARWGSVTDINSTSIGIEIDNNGFQAFTDAQLNSLVNLLDTLKRKYTIPAANFIGHSDIAPSRKVDPNIYFPWKTLASRGFGLWWGDTTNLTVPTDFNSLSALRIIGYDTRDSIAAVKAFKRHFLQDTTEVILDNEKKVLYDLMKKSW